VYGAPFTGGVSNEGGLGGETSTGGAEAEGTGGDLGVPIYGLAPMPPLKGRGAFGGRCVSDLSSAPMKKT
jgi:hypothetical protein